MAYPRTTNVDEKWNVIQNGIIKVRNILEGVTEESMEGIIGEFIDGRLYAELYTTIYNLCTHKHSNNFRELYCRYTTSFNEHLISVVLPALRVKQGEFMLRELVRRWKNHNLMARWISFFFDYVDRSYAQKCGLPLLREVGLRTFFDVVYDEVKINATNAVIALIEKEREGEQIDTSLLKDAVGIFVAAGTDETNCYENDFEETMLRESETYYSRKAASWITEFSCPEYLLKVEECLQLEKDRVFNYFRATSEQKLLDKVQNELLAHYQQQILEKDSGPRALLMDEKKDDLSRMFRLFNKVNKGLDPIKNIFIQFVTEEGTKLVKQAEDAATNTQGRRSTSGTPGQEFIQKLIEMHTKLEDYVSDCFQNHSLFKKALTEAFEAFCNKGYAEKSLPELLPAFSDNVLKRGSTEKLNDDEIDDALEKVVKILEYVHSKDLYEEHYRIGLARRLLSRSDNVSNEQSMLMKLKKQNGTQYTSKMEGMVKDLPLAKEIQNKFVGHLRGEDIHVGLDLNVTVLTTGCWPAYKVADIYLPNELVKCVEVFQNFYSKETTQRKLTWMYNLGTCTVEGRFNQKPIELVLSTYQASLLMLFNESEQLSFDYIKTLLNLEDDDVIRVLHSLACAKYKILLRNSNTEKISPTDIFKFNSEFKTRSRRIKIPLPQSEEKKKVTEAVGFSRDYAIDAAIVRIMKARKELNYQQLQSECIEQLKHIFKPDIKLIKKRIDEMIKKEYIERDPHDLRLFRYVA